MKKVAGIVSKLGMSLLVVTMLSGCKPLFDLFKKKAVEKEVVEIGVTQEGPKGAVLLNINGKPALTESDFNQHLTQMLQVNPYFKGAGPDSLPMPIKRKFFDELIKQEIIIAWAEKNNIEKDLEFIKNFEDMKKLVKRSLLVQRFEGKVLDDIKVTDRDVQDHFNQNKEKFLKEPGGVLVSAVKFENAEKANNFFDQVKNKKSEFVEMAKKEDVRSFRDFGRISKEARGADLTDIPSVLKDKALGLSRVPSIEKVEDGKFVWVMYVSDKKNDEFFKLDEIKPQLEGMLKNNKAREILENKINGLRGEFTVDVNEDFFKESGRPQLPEGIKIKTAEDVAREKAEKKEEKVSPSAAA